jgi:hypothetical protein
MLLCAMIGLVVYPAVTMYDSKSNVIVSVMSVFVWRFVMMKWIFAILSLT